MAELCGTLELDKPGLGPELEDVEIEIDVVRPAEDCEGTADGD
jgi:hypothetical protein